MWGHRWQALHHSRIKVNKDFEFVARAFASTLLIKRLFLDKYSCESNRVIDVRLS